MNYLTMRRPNGGLRVFDDFDRIVDSVFGTAGELGAGRPAVDIRSTDGGYEIEADLPGFDEQRIDVRVENDLLVIEARGEDAEESGSHEYVLRERNRRAVYRSFALPKDADPTDVTATYKNGVLHVSLAKRAEAKPRQIQIKRG